MTKRFKLTIIATLAVSTILTNACASDLENRSAVSQNTTFEQSQRCFGRWLRENEGINRFYESIFKDAMESSTTMEEYQVKWKCINDAFEYEADTARAQLDFCRENQGIWPAKEEILAGFRVPLREEIEACWQ